MKACILRLPAPVTQNPLEYADVEVPKPGAGEVLVRVKKCGVCRTDLHVVEGELPPRKSPVIPGHQVVGIIEKLGEGAKRFRAGDRVGIRLAASHGPNLRILPRGRGEPVRPSVVHGLYG